ncbi:MAG: hypothetical protein LBE25_09220 [Arthrobacter sp.]|jgi:hypothetical protein|nr:hypothetical protein [Arthrobacter sp.]
MRLLLHAASPAGLLTLLAATAAGVLPSSSDRVIVFDSRTAPGRAVGEALASGLRLPASDAPLDLGTRSDAADVLRSLAPSVVVLDAAAPEAAERLAAAAGKARLVLLDDGDAGPCPTPSQLSRLTRARIKALVYAELVPGLRPVLLRERAVSLHAVPLASLRASAEAWAASLSAPRRILEWKAAGERTALVLGRDLPGLGKHTEAEATRLAGRLMDAALDTGLRAVTYLPAPVHGKADARRLAEAAAAVGLASAVLPSGLPPAVAHHLVRPALTLSVDDPWLLALRSHGGERVQSVATGRVLPRLASLADPARPRLALVDAVLRRGLPLPSEEAAPGPRPTGQGGPTSPGQLQELVDAVAFAVAPQLLAELRPTATRTLLHSPALRSAYVPSKLLKSLRLEAEPPAADAGWDAPPTPGGPGSRSATGAAPVPDSGPARGSATGSAKGSTSSRAGGHRPAVADRHRLDPAGLESARLERRSGRRAVAGAAAGIATGLRQWWQRGSNA